MQDSYGEQVEDHPLSDYQVDLVAEAVVRKIGEKWIDREEHALHHKWVKDKMEQETAFNTSKRRIIENVVGGVSLIGLLGFVGFVGKAVIDNVLRLLGN